MSGLVWTEQAWSHVSERMARLNTNESLSVDEVRDVGEVRWAGEARERGEVQQAGLHRWSGEEAEEQEEEAARNLDQAAAEPHVRRDALCQLRSLVRPLIYGQMSAKVIG